MKLHRLRVENFAAIRDGDIAFGPGLNVLYGPNDLGKSTLADAIRLVLLLPHASTHCEPYVPWSGGGDPVVEVTFATEAQRIWRVRKVFGKGGSSVLEESRNGRDFDAVERARKVDARLREILCWGIPEPGGSGVAKGLPTSFLATALLSTQADVSAVLRDSLQGDPTATAKERIAAVLQAVAQDPLFLSLLKEIQGRRDAAYTDKGAKKTAKGSVFKDAADRLKEARDEKEHLQKVVEGSEGVERHLREWVATRDLREQARATAEEDLSKVEALAKLAADRAAAAECVRVAGDAVIRIQKRDEDVADAERNLEQLAAVKETADRKLQDAQRAEALAADALKTAEEAAWAAGSDPGTADTLARQALELRKAAAEQAATDAQQRIGAAASAQKLVDAAEDAARDHGKQEEEVARLGDARSDAAGKERTANDRLACCELLERGLDLRAAHAQVATCQADVKAKAALEDELTKTTTERATANERRAAIEVPDAAALPAMRKLETDLVGARGALRVGLVLSVQPTAALELRVRQDGVAADPRVITEALEIEANAEVEVGIGKVATVRVRGGRRDAQQRVRTLEKRWEREVLPQLRAAGVEDLEALAGKVGEARDLDTRIKTLDADRESLQSRITALAGASDALREASTRAAACQVALGGVTLESLRSEIDALGGNPAAALRIRRQQRSAAAARARTAASEAATAVALAEERARALRASWDAAIVARDAALSRFSSGVSTAAAKARADLDAARAEQTTIANELAVLQSTIEERGRRLDKVLGTARKAVENARGDVATVQGEITKAITDHAAEMGRLTELRKLRAAEDLTAAEGTLREATERHAGLPVPDREVAPGEDASLHDVLTRATRDLETIENEIHRTQGALEQVGGAVARERLRDATEAFEQAERYERETEADYEAWKLLLEQMKEADAAQASNLGQALAPALTGQFQALTAQRYQTVRLTAQLGTEGVIIGGTVRPSDRISVGTREQLSTLYRLCLGEYLQTAIVLDDQLVQSDGTRMDWFRELLGQKARTFQIVVFTCRPRDYLRADAMVPDGDAAHADTDDGFVRAIDLERTVRRR